MSGGRLDLFTRARVDLCRRQDLLSRQPAHREARAPGLWQAHRLLDEEPVNTAATFVSYTPLGANSLLRLVLVNVHVTCGSGSGKCRLPPWI